MPRAQGASAEEIALRARSERLEVAQKAWGPGSDLSKVALLGAPVLVVFALVDLLVFALLGQSYPSWYLSNGAVLSLAVPVLSGVGIDLDRRYGLISAHPGQYLGGWFEVATDWSNIWSPTGESKPKFLAGTRSVRLDRVLSTILGKLSGLALIVWFVVAGPPQYVLNVICGAPARAALGSGKVVWEYTDLTVDAGSVEWHQQNDVIDATAPKPHVDAYRVGFDVKPVSVTYALAAAALFVLETVIGQR